MRRQLTIALTSFTAVTALIGALGLIFGWLRPPLNWLANTPFTSYVWPGIILAAFVGGSAAVASWEYVRHREPAAVLGFMSAVVLAGWISGELAVIHAFSWLQAMYIAIAIILMSTTYTDAKRYLIEH